MCGCLLRPTPPMGTRPTTQACALTGNRTGDPLVCRLVLNSLSHTQLLSPEASALPHHPSSFPCPGLSQGPLAAIALASGLFQLLTQGLRPQFLPTGSAGLGMASISNPRRNWV